MTLRPALHGDFGRPADAGDERLAILVRAGDTAAFEALCVRHRAPLLAFCRRLLGSREDGEDALQETLLRAHRGLRGDHPPEVVRPWLFVIARNRCRTLLAMRRVAATPWHELELELGFDDLEHVVGSRADFRELIDDLERLPEGQRTALVLAELGDLSHAEIGSVVGCPPSTVKALVFQARTTLAAEPEARTVACEEIRAQLAVARGGALRRGPLCRHLRRCESCRAYLSQGRACSAQEITDPRETVRASPPVIPTRGLRATA